CSSVLLNRHHRKILRSIPHVLRLRNVYLQAVFHYVRGEHKDNQQHQHYVYEWSYVDFRKRSAAAAAAPRPTATAIDGKSHLFSETSLGQVEEFECEIVHARADVADASAECVVRDSGGDRGEKADGSGV